MPGGYIQNRNEDGSWPALTPSASAGFAEGSSVQYTWMIPFNPRGLFDAMGGDTAAIARLDAFFRRPDGTWAVRNAGGLHAQMSNEPSILTPWLYMFAGRPERTQETLQQVLDTLWAETPAGIPGNDDLGAMSAWYVFTAMGIFPYYPGRADLLLSAPIFERVTIRRANGRTISIDAAAAGAGGLYVSGVELDGRPLSRTWVPETFVNKGGRLSFTLSRKPGGWGTSTADVPPSFAPSSR
jgi:putative alpha-1,2-mannosidase